MESGRARQGGGDEVEVRDGRWLGGLASDALIIDQLRGGGGGAGKHAQ